jgi:beta-lactamase regulating signal transducer with metallopeptidase domain
MLETYLVSVVMKSTILLAAGLLLVRCLRGQSAAVRHLVCLTALGSAAVVPALALWLPQWSYFVAIPAGTGAALNPYRIGSAIHHWPAILAKLWAVGAILLALRAAGGWLILQRARRSSSHFMQGEAAEVRIGNVSTPLTCGVVKPLIILPRSARDWDATRLRAVLLHEFAHVRRRDCLAKHVAQASRALLWWNPLARMLSARADQERESACDEAVLSNGVAPEDYARALLDTARECSNSLLLGCAMNHSSVLRARLEHLFAWRPEVRRATRRTALAIPLLLVLMTGVSCAAKRMPQSQLSCPCIAPGTNLVSVPNIREAAPRLHK